MKLVEWLNSYRLSNRWQGRGGYREVLALAVPLIVSMGALGGVLNLSQNWKNLTPGFCMSEKLKILRKMNNFRSLLWKNLAGRKARVISIAPKSYILSVMPA